MFEKHELKNLVRLADAYVGKDISVEDFTKHCQNAKVYINEADNAWKSDRKSAAVGYLKEAKKQLDEITKKMLGW